VGNQLAVIGVPTNSSGIADGVARGPAALRARGLVSALAANVAVADLGDVAVGPWPQGADP
jgi:arginase family enzyme